MIVSPLSSWQVEGLSVLLFVVVAAWLLAVGPLSVLLFVTACCSAGCRLLSCRFAPDKASSNLQKVK